MLGSDIVQSFAPAPGYLWYPLAKRNYNPDPRRFKTGEMKTRGKYARGYPLGAIVHYSAGGPSASGTISTALKNGYAFFTIDDDGDVFQNAPLNRWGYHAGRSVWKGLVDSVSDDLVGIEVCCAGRVEKDGSGFKSYFGKHFSKSDVRVSEGRHNIAKGAYHKFTDAQEIALEKLLLWLKSNCPDVFSLDLVLGHDEVAPKRKTDPGASLSMSMPEYRSHLKQQYVEKRAY